jgi:hypothetical protein
MKQILLADGSSEQLDEGAAIESLLTAPIESLKIQASNQTLFFSLTALHDTVNEPASKMAGMTIQGDCVLVDDSPSKNSWADGLPYGLLSAIAARICIGHHASSLLPIIGVNRGWRNELIGDRRFLRSLRFQLRDPWNPLLKTTRINTMSSDDKRIVFGFKLQHAFSREEQRRERTRPPTILNLASAAGNVSSASVLACFHEASGNREEAAKWWCKAAKGGDTEALFQHGFYLYSISDQPEDAVIYLSRAVKGVLGVESLSQLSPYVPVELLKDNVALCDLLSRAALILGYAHLDGHGVKSDNEIAVKLFKMAGCSEGQRALGWLYNTGQF